MTWRLNGYDNDRRWEEAQRLALAHAELLASSGQPEPSTESMAAEPPPSPTQDMTPGPSGCPVVNVRQLRWSP